MMGKRPARIAVLLFVVLLALVLILSACSAAGTRSVPQETAPEQNDASAEQNDASPEEIEPSEEQSEPPAEETESPAEQNDPPAEQNEPPAEEIAPPEEQNEPSVEQDELPAEENVDPPAQEASCEDGLGADGKIHVYLIGPGEKVSDFESSFIDYLIYYKESGHLIICMNGKDYAFANVSESLWEDFKNAASKGKFYNAEMKGKTQYHIKDYDGTNGDLIVVEHIEN